MDARATGKWARAAVTAIGIAAVGIAAVSAAAGQDPAALTARLEATGAPVRGAALKGDSLVVALEYDSLEAMDPERIRAHALSVFRAAPAAMPAGAGKVALEIGLPGKTYATWTVSASDAAAFAAGRIDEGRLMARVEMTSAFSVKSLIEQALPDEAGRRKELQRLEAEGGRGGVGGPAGRGHAPAASAPPKTPSKPSTAAPASPRPGPGPETPKALIERGGRLLKERDYWGATECFRQALDAYPMEANQGLGLCYYGAGLVEAALRHFTEAYRLEPRSQLNVLYLATCNDKLGRRDEAVRRYEEYLSLRPDDPQVAEFVRGRLLALRGR